MYNNKKKNMEKVVSFEAFANAFLASKIKALISDWLGSNENKEAFKKSFHKKFKENVQPDEWMVSEDLNFLNENLKYIEWLDLGVVNGK